jgi:nucleoside-diphosphate-sugar epimerase
MRSIGIIGANGQVGTEVCLCLAQMTGVRVIPITRTKLGAAFLERCGVRCEVGSMQEPDEARRLLADAELVVDFSLPRGLPWEIRRGMSTNITHAIRCAPAGAPYVFISSTMAFGMPQGAPRYRRYVFARTPYSADKRFGERLTRLRGVLESRPTYAIRLGQVHGELQGVSRAMMLATRDDSVALNGSGSTPTDAVFCSTIALALRHIAEHEDPPGTYSLVESPEWSRRDLSAFYATQNGRTVNVGEQQLRDQSGVGQSLPRARGLLRQMISAGVRSLSAHKDFLTAQFMPLPPAFERRLKAQHLSRRALAEVASEGAPSPSYFDGPVPGKRLTSLSETFVAMASVRAAVAKVLEERIGGTSHNFDWTGSLG